MTMHSENFKNALQLYVGRHGIGVEAVSKMTGIKPRTIYAILRGEMRPNWDMGMALMACLPESFTNMILKDTGLTASKREVISPCQYQVASEIFQTVGILGPMFEDGKLCHRETATFKRHVGERVPSWQSFAYS